MTTVSAEGAVTASPVASRRMFAAFFPINLARIGSFGAMVVLSKLALSDWHESEIGAET